MRCIAVALAIVSLGWVLSACNEDEPRLGQELIPQTLNAQSDTLTPRCFTVREDALLTDNSNTYLIGSYQDPVFGKVWGGVYHQVLLPTKNVDLGTELSLDSIVLQLSIDGFYGDKTVQQTFNVYEMTEKLKIGTDYYSDQTFSTEATPVGSKSNFTPNPSDTVLRIKLKENFGEQILFQSGTNVMASNERFLNFLNGLYIVPDTITPGGGIMRFNFNALNTKLILYYDNSTEENLTFSFLIDNNAEVVNHFEHNYTGTQVKQAYTTADPEKGAEKIYLQAMAGTKAQLRFPDFRDKFEGMAIHQAELILTVVDENNTYTAPDQLDIARVDADGQPTTIIDQQEGETYFGGDRKKVDINGNTVKQYQFNLARHFQKLASKPNYKDYGLYLQTVASTTTADRVVIGGNHHTTYQPKLRLIYTPLN